MKERIFGLDLVRDIAIFFVIAGHFFTLYTDFYNSPFCGFSMFIQTFFLPLFYTGVPLFLLLTGYLNKDKTVSWHYYKSCIRVLLAYLFFAILTVFFRKFYLGEEFTWLEWCLKIVDFTVIPYAWYIELWIGLFLMIPFLNYLYKSLPDKRVKLVLIGILILITLIPDWVNRFGFQLLPGFWTICFPITYYYMGSFIAEYKPEIKKYVLLGIITVMCLFTPVLNSILHPGLPIISFYREISGIFVAVMAVVVFLSLYQTKTSSGLVKAVSSKISILSLDMFLFSYMVDSVVYPYFKDLFFIDQTQFGKFFFVIVPIVFVLSLGGAWVKSLLFKLPDVILGRN